MKTFEDNDEVDKGGGEVRQSGKGGGTLAMALEIDMGSVQGASFYQ